MSALEDLAFDIKYENASAHPLFRHAGLHPASRIS